MKTKSIMAGMLSMLVLAAGCNKNEVIGTGVSEGEPTYAAISVSVSAPGTRAVTGNNTYDDLEKEISNLAIYICNSQGNVESYVKNAVASGNIYVVEASTGTKTIFALANNNGVALPTPENIGTLQGLKNYAIASGNIVSGEYSFMMTGVGTGVVSQKFASEDDAKAAAEAGTIDRINVRVSRLAAKVQVALGKDISCEPSMGAHICIEEAAKPQFTIGNEPTVMFAYRDESTASTSTGNLHSIRTTWKDINVAGVFDYSCANSQYLTENYSTVTPTTSQAAYVLVGLTVHPDKTTDANGNKTEVTSHNSDFYTIANYDPMSASVSHYAETDESGQLTVLYFASEADAAGYAKNNEIELVSENTAAGYRVMAFTAGKAYYRIYLHSNNGDEKIYNALRNYYYKISVNSINSLGVGSIEQTTPRDEDLPIELKTYVGVTITVENWSEVNIPSVLG